MRKLTSPSVSLDKTGFVGTVRLRADTIQEAVMAVAFPGFLMLVRRAAMGLGETIAIDLNVGRYGKTGGALRRLRYPMRIDLPPGDVNGSCRYTIVK